MKTHLPNFPLLLVVISGLVLVQLSAAQDVRQKPVPVESKESKRSGFWGFFKKDKSAPAPAVDSTSKKVRELSKTGEVAAQKKTPAPLVKPQEPKKPGFFARILGKGEAKEKTAETEPGKVSAAELPPLPDDWSTKYIISDDDVQAYSRGPSQPGGADEILQKGAVVSMKKSGKAWAEITLDDGQSYTVGADQLRKARLTDFAPKVVATAAAPPAGPSINYEPLPTAELPETTTPGRLEMPELLLPPLPPP